MTEKQFWQREKYLNSWRRRKNQLSCFPPIKVLRFYKGYWYKIWSDNNFEEITETESEYEF